MKIYLYREDIYINSSPGIIMTKVSIKNRKKNTFYIWIHTCKSCNDTNNNNEYRNLF